MSDPIAQAAAQIDAAPSSTEPSLLEKAIDTIHELEAKVEHLIHPDAPAVAQVGESAGIAECAQQSDSSLQSANPAPANSEPESGADLPNAAATPPAGAATDANTAEHPHTAILRKLTATLRRKFNVFDGELEALLKDAESHL